MLSGLLCSVLFLTRIIAQDVPDNAGRRFVIMFLENRADDPLRPDLQVFVTGASGVRRFPIEVNVSAPQYNRGFNIGRQFITSNERVITFRISRDLEMVGTQRGRKGILITASDNVVVYGNNLEKYTNDAFLALPVDVLGKKHYAVTYFPPSKHCEVGFVATEPNTRVTVTFMRQSDKTRPISVTLANRAYSNGQILRLTLQPYETVQLQDTSDLTGTLVEGDKPIAVFSGNVRTSVAPANAAGTPSRDHMVMQVPTIETWGTKFATVPVPGRTSGDIFKIVAAEPGTRLVITGNRGLRKDTTIPTAGDYYQLTIPSNENTYIQSYGGPVMVVQITKSQVGENSPETSDPSMIPNVPVEQFNTDYTYAALRYLGTRGGRYTNYMMIIIEQGRERGLLLDGLELENYERPYFNGWIRIPDFPYYATTAQLPEQRGGVNRTWHNIRHRNPTVVFGLYVYGGGDRLSYGFPAGMRMAPLSDCVETAQARGDGLDNDCDGTIDEEFCDGFDNDRDGRIDEDCTAGRPITTRAPTTTPSPGPVIKPDNMGVKFLIMLLANPSISGSVGTPNVNYIYISAPTLDRISVRVSSPRWNQPRLDQSFFLQFGRPYTVSVSASLRMGVSGISSKAIVIQASRDILAIGANRHQSSGDTFLAFPVDRLGLEYIAVTYHPAFLNSQLGIAVLQSDTQVTIQFPNNAGLRVLFQGRSYGPGSQLRLPLLTEYDTVLITAENSDLTGTFIRANKPIAAFSGNMRTNVGNVQGFRRFVRSHLVVQLPPLNTWGTRFYKIPLTSGVHSIVKVVASQDNTIVKVDGVPFRLALRGTFLQISSQNPARIEADKPVLAIQVISNSLVAGRVISPTMILLPSVEQFNDQYYFVVPDRDTSMRHSLVLIVRNDQKKDIALDGVALPDNIQWFQIPSSSWVYAYVPVSPGRHRVYHRHPIRVFGGYLFSSDGASGISTGHPIGVRLPDINPCRPTTQIPGDYRDNDCDGKVDEEYCDGRDDDRDGQFDEDCVDSTPRDFTTRRPVVTTPTGPPPTAPPFPRGPPGLRGEKGDPGPPGPVGPVGPTGQFGSQGLIGSVGLPGRKGDPGPRGFPGQPGEKGLRGGLGLSGRQGASGSPGLPGVSGVMGNKGDKGFKGEAGKLEWPGPPGPKGHRGPAGPKGPFGSKGVSGPIGPPGRPGPSPGEVCKEGYAMDELGFCTIDIDECKTKNGDCQHVCANEPVGSYTCSCFKGFKLSSDKHGCEDANECYPENGQLKPCGSFGEVCLNTCGSYKCLNMTDLYTRTKRYLDDFTLRGDSVRGLGSLAQAQRQPVALRQYAVDVSNGDEKKKSDSALDDSNLVNGYVVLALLIWIIILTILLIIIVVCICLAYTSEKKSRERYLYYTE